MSSKSKLKDEASAIEENLDCDAVAILTFKKGKDGFIPYVTHWHSKDGGVVDFRVATSMLLGVIADLNWGARKR